MVVGETRLLSCVGLLHVQRDWRSDDSMAEVKGGVQELETLKLMKKNDDSELEKRSDALS